VPAAWVERPVWLRHTCPHGQYNDLATIWLQPAGGPALPASSSVCALDSWAEIHLYSTKTIGSVLMAKCTAAVRSIRSLISLGSDEEPLSTVRAGRAVKHAKR
jgi:hypothetical protein